MASRFFLITAAIAGALVLPTAASADSGTLTLSFDSSLLRSRIAVTPTAPATRVGSGLALPVEVVDGQTVRLTGGLTLRSGRRSVRLTQAQVTTTGTWGVRVRASSGGTQTLFSIVPGSSAPSVSATGARVSNATLKLTSDGARTLNRALKPKRALKAATIGTVTLDAQHVASTARPITGGTVTWGYSSALRNVFQSSFTPLMTGGVTQGADGLFVLPVTGGSWDPATRTGTITTGGSFRIGYQIAPTDATAHGIWVRLANTRFELNGDGGAIASTSDSGYHETPPVPVALRTVATLAPGAPLAGADGSLSWPAIAGTIAPGGEELVQYFKDSPGRPSLGDVRAIDPVSISVQLG